ncbi:hypothetical protein CYMTET_48275 [Cymbomonas tetramitiformis]|uniref:FGFR1 oncogene partner (FOP) N-terminal dimerisation domain-containing protein n=1 Tax=Cymbomonas tetramitiformis TaxID=36881 RepID=A0AAE0BSM6_9CHLO|nr:hypothetical protein CYMTET_48275 [Cymbomonas tetramitiformis]
MATLSELQDALREKLELNGVLGKIRSQIRGEIFKALDEREGFPIPELSNENLLINDLFREYLIFNGYRSTLSVFLAESGQPKLSLGRIFMSTQLHHQDDANSSKLPLVYSLIAKAQYVPPPPPPLPPAAVHRRLPPPEEDSRRAALAPPREPSPHPRRSVSPKVEEPRSVVVDDRLYADRRYRAPADSAAPSLNTSWQSMRQQAATLPEATLPAPSEVPASRANVREKEDDRMRRSNDGQREHVAQHASPRVDEPAMRLWDRSKASSPSRSQERSPKADDVSSSVEQQAMEIAIRRGGLANVKLRDASDLVAQLEEMQQEELAASPSERAYSDTFATSPTMDPRSAAKSDAPSPSHAHVNAVEAVPAPAGMSTQLLVQEPVPETLSAQPTTGSPLGALPPLAAPKGNLGQSMNSDLVSEASAYSSIVSDLPEELDELLSD